MENIEGKKTDIYAASFEKKKLKLKAKTQDCLVMVKEERLKMCWH